MLEKTKRYEIYNKDVHNDYIISNIIQQYETNNISLLNSFNDYTFKKLLYRTCNYIYDLNELNTYDEIKEMKKENLFKIQFYTTTSKKLQIASPELYKNMVEIKKTPYRDDFNLFNLVNLVKSNKLNYVIGFLKYGATHPNGFNEDMWVGIAIKLLGELGIQCTEDTTKLSNILSELKTDLHNTTLKMRNEEKMMEANKGGSKYEKKTVKELQQLCIKHNIKYSGLHKAELIKILMLHNKSRRL